ASSAPTTIVETPVQAFRPARAGALIRRPGRPDHALVLLGDRRESLVDELLHALAFVRLGREQVSFRIGRDAVHRVERAGLAAAVAEAGRLGQPLRAAPATPFIRPGGAHRA